MVYGWWWLIIFLLPKNWPLYREISAVSQYKFKNYVRFVIYMKISSIWAQPQLCSSISLEVMLMQRELLGGGGQFAIITFMEIIRKKIISSLELFRSKEWKQGNRQKMFLNRYRHSFMSKSRCKGKPGEHEVVVYWELINQDLNFKHVTQSWSNNIVQHINREDKSTREKICYTCFVNLLS